ncbi:hypothetical protein [Haloferula rosea]|uniref:Uncharacterized protein n=1 Tax=Haloferula rosea TaxID=490093 RepID=A0A934R938_9BACT|nr:hypothetical protein [Haloferula rosea]MBK1826223.1 hypothetical protein [Haloferula rosea]
MKALPLVLSCLGLTPCLRADLYVSNFTTIHGSSSATGVWRNHTTSTDLSLSVEISQSGGAIQAADGSSTASIINPSGTEIYNLWEDVPEVFPFLAGIDVFEPNFVGDYINIETQEGATTTVTMDLGALVTNPIISLTDVEYRTTLTFPSALTALAGTSNLEIAGATLSSDGTLAAGEPPPPNEIFGREAAGSIQLTGTYSTIVFTVAVGPGDATVGPNDRTGYVIATETEPQPLPSMPELQIQRLGNQIMLMWDVGDFDSIEMSGTGLSGWTAIPGLDPGAVGSWSGDLSTLGDVRFFRGVYTP